MFATRFARRAQQQGRKKKKKKKKKGKGGGGGNADIAGVGSAGETDLLISAVRSLNCERAGASTASSTSALALSKTLEKTKVLLRPPPSVEGDAHLLTTDSSVMFFTTKTMPQVSQSADCEERTV